ncbi:hypothetical protein [Bacillus sp. JJ722]|uniref:hypothetical protein n=1 Tax=Bacillus sp. JJ722 TaxID=3122973 RepID=UPI002FFEC271
MSIEHFALNNTIREYRAGNITKEEAKERIFVFLFRQSIALFDENDEMLNKLKGTISDDILESGKSSNMDGRQHNLHALKEILEKKSFTLEFDEAPSLVFVYNQNASVNEVDRLYQNGKEVTGWQNVVIESGIDYPTTHEIKYLTGCTKE